jgi:hypothetical protein
LESYHRGRVAFDIHGKHAGFLDQNDEEVLFQVFFANRLLPNIERQLLFYLFVHSPTYDLTGIQVYQDCQVEPPLNE